MIQTNAEYMSDIIRVKRVVQKFINMTLGELKNTQTREYIDFVANEIIPREGLSVEKSQNMSYIEFVCLIDQVGGNCNYDWRDHDSQSEQMFYYKCIACALFDGSKVSIPINMFMALPLKAFYFYLWMHSTSARKAVRDEFTYIMKCCKYKDDYTIEDFLIEKMNELNKVWTPIIPLKEYEKNIIAAHKDIGRLLINSFHMGFSDKFDVINICDKYHNAGKEDWGEWEGWEDEEWEDWEECKTEEDKYENEFIEDKYDVLEIESKDNDKRKDGN